MERKEENITERKGEGENVIKRKEESVTERMAESLTDHQRGKHYFFETLETG